MDLLAADSVPPGPAPGRPWPRLDSVWRGSMGVQALHIPFVFSTVFEGRPTRRRCTPWRSPAPRGTRRPGWTPPVPPAPATPVCTGASRAPAGSCRWALAGRLALRPPWPRRRWWSLGVHWTARSPRRWRTRPSPAAPPRPALSPPPAAPHLSPNPLQGSKKKVKRKGSRAKSAGATRTQPGGGGGGT